MKWLVLVAAVSCGGGTFELTADTAVGDFAVRYIKVPVADQVCSDRLAECLATFEAMAADCEPVTDASWGNDRTEAECSLCLECCGIPVMGDFGRAMLGGFRGEGPLDDPQKLQ